MQCDLACLLAGAPLEAKLSETVRRCKEKKAIRGASKVDLERRLTWTSSAARLQGCLKVRL